MRRVVFAVGAWGLGHATRDLPLIQRLLDAGCQVTVVSTGRALLLLRRHLGERCRFLDLPETPAPLGRSALHFYCRCALSLPRMLRVARQEHRFLQELLARDPYDCVISDNRYGFSSPWVDSFHVAHGVRALAPGRNRALEWALEHVAAWVYRHYDRVIVPDYEEEALAGELSHGLRFLPRERLHYIGILSSVRRRPLPEDIDYFVSLSGPEPQRTLLERKLLAQLPALRGRVVVALARPEECSRSSPRPGVEVYGFLDRAAQEEMMNRCRLVVTRSGYTTLMELAETERRAVVIPTPGQTEQEYLARYHGARGALHAVAQGRVDLARDVAAAEGTTGLRVPHKTEESVERFAALVLR